MGIPSEMLSKAWEVKDTVLHAIVIVCYRAGNKSAAASASASAGLTEDEKKKILADEEKELQRMKVLSHCVVLLTLC